MVAKQHSAGVAITLAVETGVLVAVGILLILRRGDPTVALVTGIALLVCAGIVALMLFFPPVLHSVRDAAGICDS